MVGEAGVSVSGVFLSAICRLKTCSGVTLTPSCLGGKLQGEVYHQKVHQLILHHFIPGSCGESGASSPMEPWALSFIIVIISTTREALYFYHFSSYVWA